MSLEIPTKIVDFFDSSIIPLTLSDPNLPDEPLVLANKAFYDMTGFSAAEALGANCRFMQGKDTQKTARDSIKGAFAANRDCKVLIRNYRKSGEAFDNFLYIFSVFDSSDKPLYRIGSQFDVPTARRASRFEEHSTQLFDGLKSLTSDAEQGSKQLIETGRLVGQSVKQLLMARLDSLRST